MAETNVKFDGAIPENYETHLGPLLFFDYAADLAVRVDVPNGARVLETACGTGISTELLRQHLDDSVQITATDFTEPMLAVARTKRGALAGVEFQQADATELPFEDASFDAVVCQFGVMFFPDKLAAMKEARRVLRPGGTLIFNTWDSFANNPVVGVVHEKVSTFFDADPPQFLKIPFSYYDADEITQLLAEAGLDDVTHDLVARDVDRPVDSVARGLVVGNPTIHEVAARATASPEVVIESVARSLREHFGGDPMRAQLQALVFRSVHR